MRLLRLAEGSPRKEGDAVLLAVVNNEVRLAVGKAVSVLHRNDRHNPASALNVLAGHVRESDVANLTLLAQPGQGFDRGFPGDGIVRSMELIDIDAIKTE